MNKGTTRSRWPYADPPPICKKNAANLPPSPTTDQATVAITITFNTQQGDQYVWHLQGTITDARVTTGQPLEMGMLTGSTWSTNTITNGIPFVADIPALQRRGPFRVRWHPKFGSFSYYSVEVPKS